MKKLWIITVFFLAATAVLTMQNCGGTRVITANLDVSRSTIDSQLSSVQSASVGSPSANSSAIQAFFQTLNEEGSTLFYAEAPGSMGNIDFVMPLDFGAFQLSTPSKAKAYFAFSQAGGVPHGTLIITDESNAPLIAISNDGQNLPPGSFSGVDFVMEGAVGTGSVLLTSIDVTDGDFAQTMQLEIYSGEEFLGLVTLTQALN